MIVDNKQQTIDDLVENTYVFVGWPDSQEYMDEPWFNDEAVLNIEGSGDYFIPTKYAK